MRSKVVLLLVMIVLLLAGVATTFIPFGDPAGFHGTGIPNPRETWENGVRSTMPYAMVFNIFFFWIVGFIVLLAIRMIGAGLARKRAAREG